MTVCDLAGRRFQVRRDAVLGPAGTRVLCLAGIGLRVDDAIGCATGQSSRTALDALSHAARWLGPSAIGVSGSPVDQFSFLESEDKHLNVLVRSDALGRRHVGRGRRQRATSRLMRVPLSTLFTTAATARPSWSYRPLPKPRATPFRIVSSANYLLYGTGSGWGDAAATGQSESLCGALGPRATTSELAAQPWRRSHRGRWAADAVVVGTDGKDLHFTAVRLGDAPEVADEYMRKDASQGELRSQGFFYKPDGPDSGMLGLPISVPGRAGYRHLFESSAAILFLRNDNLHFEEVGELGAEADKGRRRWLPRVVRRLVRQLAAAVRARTGAGAAGLRNRGREAEPGAAARDAAGELRQPDHG